ncbi:hypothetical protein OEZ86_008752 [Tetradesmus obliquus]|nr:hypothetical protein OEZ86_008752 [Tetradesmus obliquus]
MARNMMIAALCLLVFSNAAAGRLLLQGSGSAGPGSSGSGTNSGGSGVAGTGIGDRQQGSQGTTQGPLRPTVTLAALPRAPPALASAKLEGANSWKFA